MPIRGAITAEIKTRRANPLEKPRLPREDKLRPTIRIPMITIVTFEKLGSFFSLINARL